MEDGRSKQILVKSNEMLSLSNYCSGPSPDAPACSKASNYGKRWQLLSTGETFSFSFLSFRVLSSWQLSPQMQFFVTIIVFLCIIFGNHRPQLVPLPYYLLSLGTYQEIRFLIL